MEEGYSILISSIIHHTCVSEAAYYLHALKICRDPWVQQKAGNGEIERKYELVCFLRASVAEIVLSSSKDPLGGSYSRG